MRFGSVTLQPISASPSSPRSSPPSIIIGACTATTQTHTAGTSFTETSGTTYNSTAGTIYTIESGGGSPSATNKVDINPS